MNSPETPPSSDRRRVAVTGSSGLIGSALVRALRAEGHEVLRLVRREPRPGRGEVGWDPREERIDAAALSGVDAVVHLAGASVGERWTDERKRRIRESRVQGTSLLSRSLADLPEPPRVLVSVSAIGYYGDRGDEPLSEESDRGGGFLSGVAVEWEAAAEPAARAGVRVVTPRLGVVLSPDGGALQRMLPVFRLGLGGRLGDGGQWMSWVSLPDVIRAFSFLIGTPEVKGPVNVVAPEPVTNAEFTRTLGHALGRPTPLFVPKTALRLAFGEMADETLLASQRVVPARLVGAGFHFRHPHLEGALRAVLGGE